jgi:hypothetical protein
MGWPLIRHVRPEFGVAFFVTWVILGIIGMALSAGQPLRRAGTIPNLYFAAVFLAYAIWFFLAALQPRIGRIVVSESSPSDAAQRICLPVGMVFKLFALGAASQAFALWAS